MSAIMSWLQQQQYVEQVEWLSRRCWALTQAGRDFSLASAMKPLKRKTAQRLLNEFLERCRSLPLPDSPYLYVVHNAILFGSFLDERRATINDIDLAVGLKPKYQGAEKYEAECRLFQKHRIHPSSDKSLTFAEDLTVKFLKNRSNYFSFTSTTDPILEKDIPKRVLYRDGVEEKG
jgi:hypothetical protein